jgi:predicted  nucleic acid-binding Zn-ribbon protein
MGKHITVNNYSTDIPIATATAGTNKAGLMSPSMVDDLATAKSAATATGHTHDTDQVTEGSVNKYFSNALAIASVLTDYAKASAVTLIDASTTLLQAIGILEKALDGKQDTITGAATTVTSSDLTANSVLVSDNTGKIDVSSITTTKLGYLTDVTSNIQSQFTGVSDEISTLETTVTTNTTDITSNASAISALETTVSTNTTDITSNASAISALETTVSTNTTDITSNASAISALETSVSTNTTDITSNASAISALETTVSTNTTDITSNASAISALETSVSTNTTDITSNASAISALETTVSTHTTDITSNASAISALETTVSTHTTDITSNASAISALETSVSTNTTDITSNASSISALETTVSNKQDTITGAATTVTSSDLTANSVLVSDSTGKIDVSSITTTKLGYLTDVTSNIQSQFTGKEKTITKDSTQPSEPSGGELWVDTTNTTVNILKRYNGSGWVTIGFTDASLLTSGSLPDGRLSTNVAMRNTANTFTLAQTISQGSATAIGLSMQATNDTHGRFSIDQSGKIEWGSGSAARDTTLQRSSPGALTANGSIIATSFVGNLINVNGSSTAAVTPSLTGIQVTTGTAANIALKVINNHTTPTGNLTEWVKISTTVAKVDVNGNADFNTVRAGNAALNTSATLAVKGADSSAATRGFRLENSGNSHYVDMYNDGSVKSSGKINSVAGLQENGTDLTAKYRQVANPITMVDMAVGTIIEISDIPESEKVKLRASGNWNDDTGVYGGPPLVSCFHGMTLCEIGIDTSYMYTMIGDNRPIRLLRG